ncbi:MULTISPECIES: TPM domain-containing protein [unclassified Salinibacterium]|uniref:TPM domain-containing protein n=1 Tax=unclassified Salinibacterium TaxID=2632331 RepID=UPI00143D25F4|nr:MULTISPECIES: TPM domain-containing protein [unclassified Salinibacterium]
MTTLAAPRRIRPFLRRGTERAFAALLLAIAAVCTVPAAASAEEPVRFGGSDVVDAAGVLGGETAAVEDALDELYAEASIQLLVAYVDTFDGMTPAAWAERTAERNGLGTNDMLLAVAIEDRNYVTWYPDDFELSEGKTRSVEQDDIEPRLRADDWSGAAIAAAEGYARASQGINWLPILAGAAVVGLGAWGFSAFRRRRAANAQTRANAARLEELEQRASVALVALDDELMTSSEELGFAAAQFGEQATKPFRDAVAEARAKSMEAFAIKQRLDDTEEEPDAERAAMAEQIIALTAEGDATLDAQAAAFAELRELEKNAPQALAEAERTAGELEGRVAASERALSDMAGHYDVSALSAVADNPAQARELLRFAAESRNAAEKSIAAGQSGDAAVQVRAAQGTAGRITQLIDAVDALATELADASARLAEAVRDTQDDLAAARALADDPRMHASTQELTRATGKASAAVERASSPEGQRDPLLSLTALTTADAELDRLLAAAREEQERTARAIRQLPDTIKRAESSVAQASSFITTRRGAVREHARTRLAEAERLLATAVAAQHDPVGAVNTALRAADAADAALSRAQSDVRAASAYGSSDSNDSAVLGALLGDFIFGGSASRGTTWGGSLGGWSGSSGRRGSSSSSRSRSRSLGRSSGRSFGGSRGRTGGGRF